MHSPSISCLTGMSMYSVQFITEDLCVQGLLPVLPAFHLNVSDECAVHCYMIVIVFLFCVCIFLQLEHAELVLSYNVPSMS